MSVLRKLLRKQQIFANEWMRALWPLMLRLLDGRTLKYIVNRGSPYGMSATGE